MKARLHLGSEVKILDFFTRQALQCKGSQLLTLLLSEI